jgi:hypothetical protein
MWAMSKVNCFTLRRDLKVGAMFCGSQPTKQARPGREKFLSEQKFIPDQIPHRPQ